MNHSQDPENLLTPEDEAYQIQIDALPKIGMRVRLTCDVHRYPHFIALAGSRGTVTQADEEVFAVKMDSRLPGSEEWDNEICWYPRNCDDWPNDEIEVLIPAVTDAIVNIQSAIRVIARIWEYTHNDDLAGAQSDLEQAVRYLLNTEEPS